MIVRIQGTMIDVDAIYKISPFREAYDYTRNGIKSYYGGYYHNFKISYIGKKSDFIEISSSADVNGNYNGFEGHAIKIINQDHYDKFLKCKDNHKYSKRFEYSLRMYEEHNFEAQIAKARKAYDDLVDIWKKRKGLKDVIVILD